MDETTFLRALGEYRKRWPEDGYTDSDNRYLETFRVFNRYYQGGKVVDVGGWPGDLSCLLAMLGFDITLIDKDPKRPTVKSFDHSADGYITMGPRSLAEKCYLHGISTLSCDIERERIPLEDRSVDFVVFTEVIEHLRVGPLNALREIRRVLKTGGRALLSTPNLLSLKNRISFVTGRASYDTLDMPYSAVAAEERIGHGGHFRVFSMPELVDLVQRSGFRIIHRTYRQLIGSGGTSQSWSLYATRMRVWNHIIRYYKPFTNTIFLVLIREGDV